MIKLFAGKIIELVKLRSTRSGILFEEGYGVFSNYRTDLRNGYRNKLQPDDLGNRAELDG